VAKEHETSVDRALLDGFGSVEGLVDLVQLLFYYLNKLVKGVGRVATVRQLLLHHSRIIALLILHTGSARRLVLHHQFTHYVLLESSMSVAWLCPAVQVEAGAESLQRAAQHVCALEDSQRFLGVLFGQGAHSILVIVRLIYLNLFRTS